jgi:hypothetical protein
LSSICTRVPWRKPVYSGDSPKLEIEAGAVQTRHLQIAHDQVIGRRRVEQPQGIAAVARRLHGVTVRGEHRGHQLPHRRLVVHHEHALG